MIEVEELGDTKPAASEQRLREHVALLLRESKR
jgi:hypothetical protein